MISKELISEVLNLNITYIELYDNSIIYKISVYDREEEVNIYELAYKCKEWAFNNGGYVLESRSYNQKCYKWEKEAFCYIHLPISGMGQQYWANIEVQAIFKACEWILNENNIKSN